MKPECFSEMFGWPRVNQFSVFLFLPEITSSLEISESPVNHSSPLTSVGPTPGASPSDAEMLILSTCLLECPDLGVGALAVSTFITPYNYLFAFLVFQYTVIKLSIYQLS